MDIEVLHQLPREALIEKACRLRQSVDDMLSLWGDLQIEGRSLRSERRHLNQEVAKLVEDFRRVRRDDGLIGESLKRLGYGEVVDAIRDSIVDTAAQAWTSGVVSTLSASLSEAASYLLPQSESSYKARRLFEQCERDQEKKLKGREEKVIRSGSFSAHNARCQGSTSESVVGIDLKCDTAAEESVPLARGGSLPITSFTKRSPNNSAELLIAMNEEYGAPHYRSSRSTTISECTPDPTTEMFPTEEHHHSLDKTSGVIKPKEVETITCQDHTVATASPTGSLEDPFSQNLLLQGSELLQGARVLRDRSESVREKVSKWILSEEEETIVTASENSHAVQANPFLELLPSANLDFSFEELESKDNRESEARLMNEEEGKIAIQIEAALGLQSNIATRRFNHKRQPICRKAPRSTMRHQKLKFVPAARKIIHREDGPNMVAKDEDVKLFENSVQQSSVKSPHEFLVVVEPNNLQDSERLYDSKNSITSAIDIKVEERNIQDVSCEKKLQHHEKEAQKNDLRTNINSRVTDGRIEDDEKETGEENQQGSVPFKFEKVVGQVGKLQDRHIQEIIPSEWKQLFDNKGISSEVVEITSKYITGDIMTTARSSIVDSSETHVNTVDLNIKCENPVADPPINMLNTVSSHTNEVNSAPENTRRDVENVVHQEYSSAKHLDNVDDLPCVELVTCDAVDNKQKEHTTEEKIQPLCGSSLPFAPGAINSDRLSIPDSYQESGSELAPVSSPKEKNHHCRDNKGKGISTAEDLSKAYRPEDKCPTPPSSSLFQATITSSALYDGVIPCSDSGVSSPLEVSPVHNEMSVASSSDGGLCGYQEPTTDLSPDIKGLTYSTLSENIVLRTNVATKEPGSPVAPSSVSFSQQASSTRLQDKQELSALNFDKNCAPKPRQLRLCTEKLINISIRHVDCFTAEVSWALDVRRLLLKLIDLGRRTAEEHVPTKQVNATPLKEKRVYRTTGLEISLGKMPMYLSLVFDCCEPNKAPRSWTSPAVAFSHSQSSVNQWTEMIPLPSHPSNLPAIFDVIVYGTPSHIALVSDNQFARENEEKWLRLGIDSAMVSCTTAKIPKGTPLLPGGVPLFKAGIRVEFASDEKTRSIRKLNDFVPARNLWQKSWPLNLYHRIDSIKEINPAAPNQLTEKGLDKNPLHSKEEMNKQQALGKCHGESADSAQFVACIASPCTVISPEQSEVRFPPLEEEKITAFQCTSQSPQNSQIPTSARIVHEAALSNKDSLYDDSHISELLDNIKRFDSLGVTGSLVGERILVSALRRCTSNNANVFSITKSSAELEAPKAINDKQDHHTPTNSSHRSSLQRTQSPTREPRCSNTDRRQCTEEELNDASQKRETAEPSTGLETGVLTEGPLLEEGATMFFSPEPREVLTCDATVALEKHKVPFRDSKPVHRECKYNEVLTVNIAKLSSERKQQVSSPAIDAGRNNSFEHLPQQRLDFQLAPPPEKLPPPSQLDITARMVRANNLHQRLLSEIKAANEDWSPVSHNRLYSRIPRLGVHRVADSNSPSHQPDSSSKSLTIYGDNNNRLLAQKSQGIHRHVFVVRVQVDDTKFEELRFANDSDIHARCEKFLCRHGIKPIFQSGLESMAEGFIEEARRYAVKKVFHERLKINVYLKTVDLADLLE